MEHVSNLLNDVIISGFTSFDEGSGRASRLLVTGQAYSKGILNQTKIIKKARKI